MSKRTIIYSRGGGRTCDQLLTLAQFVAFVEEYAGEFSVVDIPFWPYGAGFAPFASDRICAVTAAPGPWIAQTLRAWERVTRLSGRALQSRWDRIRTSLHWRLTRALERRAARARDMGFWIGDTRDEAWEKIPARRRDFLYLDHPEVLADLRRHPVSVVCGPKIRCWDLVMKHEDVVRQTLRIRDDLSSRARHYLGPLRERYDFLVGVSVRQTDYREYVNGRFFFTSEQYAAWMREALALFADRGRLGFVVASDEAQDPQVFAGLPVHFATGSPLGQGHYLEDLAELGGCDVVMTTASSFGCWGAFIGRAPILPLVQVGRPLRADEILAKLWDCTHHPDLSVAIW